MKRQHAVLGLFLLAACVDQLSPLWPARGGDSIDPMSKAPFSTVKYNAREQALTSDMTRSETLLSRDMQNLFAAEASSSDGTPYSTLSMPINLTAAAGFTMTLAGGQAFTYDPSITDPEASPYAVTRWAQQVLTFANPDGANPRIDLVIATPGTVDADSASRNILVDPVPRTISPQSVFKTTNPSAAISIVTGTPGATPASPAVPAGAIALFEVLVGAAAADSTTFLGSARIWRRAPFPYSVRSGVIHLDLSWDLTANPTTTSSTLLVSGNAKVLIDGELIDTVAYGGASPVPVALSFVSQDAGGNNPFAVAAPANAMKPYYLYAVGGRHCPQGFGGPSVSPLGIVESLVPPDLSNHGRPTAPITTPRGVTTQAGAVYVGIGFVVQNSTRRAPCVMTSEFTYVNYGLGAQFIGLTKAGTGHEAFGDPTSRPTVARRALAYMTVGSAAIASGGLVPDRGDGTAPAPGDVAVIGPVFVVRNQVAGGVGAGTGVIEFNPANHTIWLEGTGTGLNTGDVINLTIRGYEHRVDRI